MTKLQDLIVERLEEAGWYFDWNHHNDFWSEPDDTGEIRVAQRTSHSWTLPQWAEYWSAPYDDVPDHPNYGKPRTRRYEDLQRAVWSQLLREEEPGTYEPFFRETRTPATQTDPAEPRGQE